MLYFPSHTWQFVVYISFRLQKLNRKISYCCICWSSLVHSASSAVSAWFRTTYLEVRAIHTISSSKLNRKIAYCIIRWCSLVLSASSAVYAWFRTTYLAVRGIHIISSSKIKPENRVPLYTFMFARAFGIFCCLCFNSHHIPGSSHHFVFKN